LTDGSRHATTALVDSAPEPSLRVVAGRFTTGVFGGIPALIHGVQEVVGSNPTAPTRFDFDSLPRSQSPETY
jgi:hypothetical protein